MGQFKPGIGLVLTTIVFTVKISYAGSANPVDSLGASEAHQCDSDKISEVVNEVWIPAGNSIIGSHTGYLNERPKHLREIRGFWIDRTEVTNAMFAAFVNETGYVTTSEKAMKLNDANGREVSLPSGSLVFSQPSPDKAVRQASDWWSFIKGADWKHPEGKGSTIDGRQSHPVVHVSHTDAMAYAEWAGRSLPTEAQWERAATYKRNQNSGPEHIDANTWQGFFPFQNTGADGHASTAPVGCYKPSASGLYDMIGNVWEWVHDAYKPGHEIPDQAQTTQAVALPGSQTQKVIKGGSYLCSANFCSRFRSQARLGMHVNDATAHIGFRTVRYE